LNQATKTLSLALVGALVAAYPAKATDFTLSDSAVMSLDYNLGNFFVPPPTASVVSRQDVPGEGVQYDIHFASTTNQDISLYQVSDRNYGAGTLANMDVSAYSNYNLKFTVLSIDGSTSGNGTLVVGAVIGLSSIGTYYQYQPKVIALTGANPSSAVSSTTVSAPTTFVIGFTAHLFTGWSAGPHDVTLLVQPAAGAVQVPEPSTFALAGLGTVALLVARRLHRRSS
jgi:hypothetical protein